MSRPFWRLLRLYQVDAEFVFREAGLDPTLMNESRSRYKEGRVQVAWAKAASFIGDPCFGLRIAEVWYPTDLHALGYAFLASSTLRTGLQRLARYAYVLDNVVGFELEDDGERFSLLHTTEKRCSFSRTPAEEDASWAFVMSLCRASYGKQLYPVEVRLQHEELACQGEYDRFFRCPVLLGTDGSAIVFAHADVDRPLPAPNRELARANDKVLSTFLANLQQEELIGRVKVAISHELPSGTPSDEEIAKAVYMSPRTLRRRLLAEGTSYSQLLDAVRRELAEQYIADPARSLSETGFLLGFSELSAFSRAFKRWTGQTPSAFRETVCT
ncbi:MAG: AraC family transcriptional regulator [Chromatiaceae bacterium]|nr:AraC family transcriptional regulator [Chromatiaceae bacterium]